MMTAEWNKIYQLLYLFPAKLVVHLLNKPDLSFYINSEFDYFDSQINCLTYSYYSLTEIPIYNWSFTKLLTYLKLYRKYQSSNDKIFLRLGLLVENHTTDLMVLPTYIDEFRKEELSFFEDRVIYKRCSAFITKEWFFMWLFHQRKHSVLKN